MKSCKPSSALEALEDAHQIALAPFVFQATACLLDFGLLALLEKSQKNGLTLTEAQSESRLSRYAVETLFQFATSFRLIEKKGQKYFLAKSGWFLLNDPFVRTNFSFTKDVCYRGLENLKTSFLENRPAGLSALGNWNILYPALSKLPEPAKTSWFRFDHLYSDTAFRELSELVFRYKPHKIFDVGGNTGKWSILYAEREPNVQIYIHDLPQQCLLAREQIEEKGLSKRVKTVEIDVLKADSFPYSDADLWLMSQFLDCFEKEEITSILRKVKNKLTENARLLILEPCVGAQPFETGDQCLSALSLYFTAIANGNSRFYTLEEFEECIRVAGLSIEKIEGPLGTGHTLIICRAP